MILGDDRNVATGGSRSSFFSAALIVGHATSFPHLTPALCAPKGEEGDGRWQ